MVEALKCADCGQLGSVTWDGRSAVRRMAALSQGFHIETGRTIPGKTLIVCDRCDAYLVD